MGRPLTSRDIKAINDTFEKMPRERFLYTLIIFVIFFLFLGLYFNSQFLF